MTMIWPIRIKDASRTKRELEETRKHLRDASDNAARQLAAIRDMLQAIGHEHDQA